MVEEDVHVTSVLKTADNNQVMYEASDPKASYTIVNPKAFKFTNKQQHHLLCY
eukprot:COSAG05_NODE_5278_length_1217_cov_1.072451_2_plen_53_part_00